jgi:hypothetical protein
MQTSIKRWLRVIVVVCIGALTVPAEAASVHDPNLARGPLDLKWLVADKHDAGAPLHLKVVTYGRWKANLLDKAGRNRIYVLFNPKRAEQEQFVGEVFFRDGRLWMRITRRNGDFIRRIPAYHPRGDTVKAVVPNGLPNPDGQTWLAATEEYGTDDGPCADLCDDRVPDAGWLKLTPGL